MSVSTTKSQLNTLSEQNDINDPVVQDVLNEFRDELQSSKNMDVNANSVHSMHINPNQIPKIDWLNTVLDGDDFASKVYYFYRILLPIYNNKRYFYSKIGNKTYLFQAFFLDNNSVYEKYFFLQKKNDSLNKSIQEQIYFILQDEETGEINLLIELRDIISVNFIHRFLGSKDIFLDEDLIHFLSSMAKYFSIDQVIIHNTYKSYYEIASKLSSMEIKVHRPLDRDFSELKGNDIWNVDGYYNYCPRDSMFVVQDKVLATPMTLRHRQFEAETCKPLFDENHWFEAPKPKLLDSIYQRENLSIPTLLNGEPVFDAANVIKAGYDILYLVSNTGNKDGAIWLENWLREKGFKYHGLIMDKPRIKDGQEYFWIDNRKVRAVTYNGVWSEFKETTTKIKTFENE